MKKFILDNTQNQRDEMTIYAFSPDTLSANEKDLNDFLLVFCHYIPTRGTPWKKDDNGKYTSKALSVETPIQTSWTLAHAQISSLIKEKKESKRHRRLFLLSALSILVLSLSLGYKMVVSDSKIKELKTQINAIQSIHSNSLKS